MGQKLVQEIKQSLDDFGRNCDWFQEHLSDMQEKYENKAVAVKDQKIIGVAGELENLMDKLDRKGVDFSDVYIKVVPQKGIIYIF